MSWTDGDIQTIFLQGVIPLVLGIGLCFVGCLYLFGVIQWSCKRHDDQVAPVVTASSGNGSSGESSSNQMTLEQAHGAYGRVACEAQLYGFREKERRAVLEHMYSDCCTHGETKKAPEDTTTADDDDLEEGMVIDTRCACAICLREYEDEDEVLTGSACEHKFHKRCVLLWLANHKKPKDHCPYCRKEFFSASQLKQAALDVLGPERVEELARLPTNSTSSTDFNTTTTTMSNSTISQDTADASPPAIENDLQ